MKKLFIIFAMLLGSQTINAQNVKQTETGNFIQIDYLPQTEKTGKTYTDLKGNVYEVHITKTKKLFVNRISKSGKPYRQYLKTQA